MLFFGFGFGVVEGKVEGEGKIIGNDHASCGVQRLKIV
jgi:hypothetical protein